MAEQLLLDDRNKLSITGISEVQSFSEREIKLLSSDKSRIFIRGDNLKISSFSKQSGAFLMEGKISEIKFNEKKDLLGRIFK